MISLEECLAAVIERMLDAILVIHDLLLLASCLAKKQRFFSAHCILECRFTFVVNLTCILAIDSSGHILHLFNFHM